MFMDEVETPNLTIDLDDELQKQEVELKLTLGQLLLINEFLSKHIQPKGFLMIEFSYDLFKRLNTAIESVQVEEENKETFVGTGDF
tara:strand:- start:194 stop:451 length:258 start_codon:yes stop_codon:yes gene_type:complete